jgi:GNAT superfamily N-acetyltransferase
MPFLFAEFCSNAGFVEIFPRTGRIKVDMITTRQAAVEDASALANLVTELGYPGESAEMLSRIEKLPSGLYCTLVAVVEDKVVGFIGLLTLPVYEYSHPVGWILALCVSSKERGSGIGKALLAAAERHYRNQGVIDMRLHSGLQRGEAHQFYEKMGFDKSGYRFKKTLSPEVIP